MKSFALEPCTDFILFFFPYCRMSGSSVNRTDLKARPASEALF